jgi:SAM-dependent methyltransferase
VYGTEIEPERAAAARARAAGLAVAAGEALPFPEASFDVVFSHEMIEHVEDDRLTAREMVRVLRPGGRLVIFCPNRGWPFETHGIYWRGNYRFGNIPLINYLPRPLRNRLAPHVRVYTLRALLGLFTGEPMRLVAHRYVAPGLDNVSARFGAPGRLAHGVLMALERTPLALFAGISHLLVLERLATGQRAVG